MFHVKHQPPDPLVACLSHPRTGGVAALFHVKHPAARRTRKD